MLYHNQYTDEQKEKLIPLLKGFPIDKIPTVTRWKCLVLPIEVKDYFDVSKYEALSKLNEGKGLISAKGTQKALEYNRAQGHLVAVGDMYGIYHKPVSAEPQEHNKAGIYFPPYPTAMPEIGDPVVLGKWTGQYLKAYDPETDTALKFKIYIDDEILAVADPKIKIYTSTDEEHIFDSEYDYTQGAI